MPLILGIPVRLAFKATTAFASKRYCPSFVPGSVYCQRKDSIIADFCSAATAKNHSDVLIIKEDRKEPSSRTHEHLPESPTAVYNRLLPIEEDPRARQTHCTDPEGNHEQLRNGVGSQSRADSRAAIPSHPELQWEMGDHVPQPERFHIQIPQVHLRNLQR